MNSKILKYIFCFFAVILIFFYFYFGFKSFSLSEIWKSLYHSDFYITYQGGFVRRGLDGELLYIFSKTIYQDPVFIQKIYNAIFLFLFFCIIFYFTARYKPPFFALFSTSVLLLAVFYFGRGIRKDHILLSFFFISSFLIERKVSLKMTFLSLNLLFITATLIHELFFIISFFPVVILLKNFIYQEERFSGYLRSAVFLLPAILVFFIIIFFGLGNAAQQQAILAFWKSVGVTNIFFNSGIFDRSLYIWELGLTQNQYITFIFAVALHFLFILIMIINDLQSRKLIRMFFSVMALQYGVLIILCIVAKDFSRWIFMCNLTVLATVYILKKDKKYNDVTLQNSFSFFKKIFWVPYILFFINTMPHSGWSFNGYIVYNPVNIVYKIVSGKYIF